MNNNINFKGAEAIRVSTMFRRSNKFWNMYGYNSRASIGHLMKLINQMRPVSLEDWIYSYLDSGKEYERLLKAGAKVDPSDYGRSKYQLKQIASDFHQDLLNNNFRIDYETTYQYVLIRVLYETWIGYSRERHIFNVLKSFFNTYEVRHADPIVDIEMAVDFEILKNGKLLLGIQAKGNNTSPTTLKLNQRKNKRYTSQYGAEVFYLVYNEGKIENLKELSKTIRRIKF